MAYTFIETAISPCTLELIMYKNTSIEESSAEIVARVANCQIVPLNIQGSFC